MKLDRAGKDKRNLFFGTLNKVVTVVLPFIVRTTIIHILGAEYLGLGSLFSSILQVLSLTELGVGSAIVYSMYKPIANDDNDTLCALLAFYKKIYFMIGIFIMAMGLIIIPVLPKLINGSYPDTLNIYYLYLIYLINTVSSYVLFAFKGSLLNAYQRVDISNNINSVVNILMYFFQIIILITTRNYYLYAVLLVIGSVVINFLVAYYTNKLFPQIICRGKISDKKKQDIKVKLKGLMLNKVCQVSRNAFDSIFVSMFLGLAETAIYNNYYSIMNAVTSFLAIVSQSILGGVGNSVETESIKKNYFDMIKINFIYMWISGVCTVCLLCLYQPFTQVFFGKDMVLSINAVILFCIYFYVLKMGDIRSVYVHANGLWWENKYRSIIEAISNLALNYFLGKYFGIYGIITATLISLFFINFLWGSGIIFKYYFIDISIKEYYGLHFLYAITTIIACWITYNICELINIAGIVGLFFRLVICMILPNIIFILFYRKTKEYKAAMPWLIKKITE